MAVLVVTGVGSTVDYLKEQEFNKRTREENAGYKVSSTHPPVANPPVSLSRSPSSVTVKR